MNRIAMIVVILIHLSAAPSVIAQCFVLADVKPCLYPCQVFPCCGFAYPPGPAPGSGCCSEPVPTFNTVPKCDMAPGGWEGWTTCGLAGVFPGACEFYAVLDCTSCTLSRIPSSINSCFDGLSGESCTGSLF